MLFSSQLKTNLEEIVRGYHNDAKCFGYENSHHGLHRKDTLPCKYKEYPEQIPKLLLKIDVNDQHEIGSNS